MPKKERLTFSLRQGFVVIQSIGVNWSKEQLAGQSEECFNEFFDRLGTCYKDLRQRKNVDIYHHIRCGLAHAYLIEGNDSIIDMKRGSCGIEYHVPFSNSYTFHIPTYFEDFKKAVIKYIDGLDTGSENLSLIERALEHKPELI